MKKIQKQVLFLVIFSLILTFKETIVFWDRGVAISVMNTIYRFFIYAFVGSLTMFLNKKNQVRALFILDLVLSTVLFGDMVYQRYYNEYLTVELLPLIKVSEGNLLGSIGSLLKITDIIFFITIPVYIYILRKVPKEKKEGVYKYYSQRAAVVVLVAVIALTSIFVKYQVHSNYFILTYDRKKISDKFGLVFYHYNDIMSSVRSNLDKSEIPEEDLLKIESFLSEKDKEKKDNSFTGIAEGKNLILVQLESLQNFAINLQIEGKEVTPNLNKIAAESLYFNNFYAQTAAGNTSDAEFLTNNSLYPLSVGSAYFTYGSNYFYPISRLLEDEGYYTSVMHGYNNTFWNRNVVYNSYGIDSFYYGDYYQGETLGWGINDMDFLQESVDFMKDLPNPFYSFVVTLTSHHPFGHVNDDNRVELGDYEESPLNDYLEDVAYLDEAVGQFMEKLKATGLYDNSIIVFYGDHRGMRDDTNELLTEYLGVENNSFNILNELTKVPFMIHIPGEEGEEYSLPAGQVDIQPTLMNLFGIDTKVALGSDLLGIDNNSVIFRNGSFITSDYLYQGEEEQLYTIDGEPVEMTEEMNSFKEQVNRTLNISDMILKYNIIESLTTEQEVQ
ncbi:LTA synthase family protein [Alloiococcus sp. CFN-8]|uniref:LTA synthase family protein n=1 Tax=Alloiococcus sp. CFN-8 TaxID=3416081 RepID=UPI003CF6ED55